MLKAITSVSVLMVFGLSALSACQAKSRNNSGEIYAVKSICEAARLPIGASGFRVTLNADFISDRKERSLLQDDICPHIVVVPFDGPKTVKDAGYRSFASILDANPLHVGLVKARVTVYGTLREEAPNKYRLDVIRYISSVEQRAK
jgi:hypothetical protein